MAIITTYSDDATTSEDDKYLTVDVGGATKLTAAAILKEYILPDSGVTAPKLATGAITLGYTQITSSFNTSSTTVVQITGLTAAVTIPAGGRRVRITAYVPNLGSSAAPKTSYLSIWDGAVSSGTKLVEATQLQAAASTPFSGFCVASAVVTPAAGAKTYNVGLASDGGGGGVTAWATVSATSPAYILVEAI